MRDSTAAGLQGIDVSHYQGEIDWQAVKASGVVFAFARALEGETDKDKAFAVNWQGMKEAGVVRAGLDELARYRIPEPAGEGD